MKASANPIDCDHPRKRIGTRAKSNGDLMAIVQCCTCGETFGVVSHARAKQEAGASRIEEVPQIDEGLKKRGRDLANKHYEDQRRAWQQERNEKSREWWIRYNGYLSSQRWRDKRARVLERDGHTCQACLRRRATQVHHTTYEHVFDEPLFDLQSVCDVCHNAIHDNREGAA